jgi:hypothetical protein
MYDVYIILIYKKIMQTIKTNDFTMGLLILGHAIQPCDLNDNEIPFDEHTIIISYRRM